MIHLIRHAESEFNRYRTNTRDCSITVEGQIQARELTGEYDLVIVSPLRRAHQTLAHSQITYKEKFIHHDIREFKDGAECNLLEYEPDIVEELDELYDRVARFRQELKVLSQKYPRIAVISHFMFLQSLIHQVHNHRPFIHNAKIFPLSASHISPPEK